MSILALRSAAGISGVERRILRPYDFFSVLIPKNSLTIIALKVFEQKKD
jgi:hypothetical protein